MAAQMIINTIKGPSNVHHALHRQTLSRYLRRRSGPGGKVTVYRLHMTNATGY